MIGLPDNIKIEIWRMFNMVFRPDLKVYRKMPILAAAVLILVCFSVPAFGAAIPAGEADDPSFPTYGSGKVGVRVYADYLCGPCQNLEPELDPIIERLVKKGSIKVTFIDAPGHRESVLLIRYFLYSINRKNTFENAMATRRALFEAAKNKISDEKELEAYLKGKKIAFVPYDVRPIFMKMNNYLQVEGIRQTPSCVIEKNGKTETITKGTEIIKALRAIK
jgi:hypothetical protein